MARHTDHTVATHTDHTLHYCIRATTLHYCATALLHCAHCTTTTALHYCTALLHYWPHTLPTLHTHCTHCTHTAHTLHCAPAALHYCTLRYCTHTAHTAHTHCAHALLRVWSRTRRTSLTLRTLRHCATAHMRSYICAYIGVWIRDMPTPIAVSFNQMKSALHFATVAASTCERSCQMRPYA